MTTEVGEGRRGYTRSWSAGSMPLLVELPARERDWFVRTVNRLVADVPAAFHD